VRSLCRYLIAAIALAIVTAACSSSQNLPPPFPPNTNTNTNTTTNNGTVTTTPRLPAGLTAELLDAHLGVGIPTGWLPVDEGETRVWVPPDWVVLADAQTKTTFCGSSAPGLISIGSLPFVGCDQPYLLPIPQQEVALIPSSQKHTGQPSRTFHGYRIYNVISSTAEWTLYDVPQLGVRIATHGTLGSRILQTLAPSVGTIALGLADDGVPSDWHTVTENGVSLSIPPSWDVITPTYFYCNGWPSDDLVLVKPDLAVAACGAQFFTPPTPAGAFHEDLSLYLPPHNSQTPAPNGTRIGTVEHGSTETTIYTDVNDPNALDLFVRKTGSNITHDLTLGLGRDGRVAGGVLASMRAVT